jgi:uncharacterized protein YqeY
MKLFETINADYIAAYKAKDTIAKSALSGLKAKIQDAEKAKHAGPITDDLVLKVIISAAKTRTQSIAEYEKAGRTDLVDTEKAELKVIEKYLPAQLNPDGLRSAVLEVLASLPEGPAPKRIGMATGAMNKKFAGQFDNANLQELLKELV